MDDPATVAGIAGKLMTMDIVKLLRFELRDWKAGDRFHFPSINALTVEQAATEILSLRAKVAELEGDLRKANSPVWFYHPDYTEVCQWSPYEVVDDYYDPEPGDHVFEVECARPLKSIWCAVRVTNDMDADERFTLTEHATEAEARAHLERTSHDPS